jgi:PAS domain S-box-containing protein
MNDEGGDPQANDLTQGLARLPREIRFILDKAPAGISYIDCDQVYRYANERFLAWWGHSVVGQHIRDSTGDAIYETIRAHIEKALSGQTAFHENQIHGPDGRTYWHHAIMVPDVEDGVVRGYVLMMTDVTRRKEAELALEAERRRYEERLEAEVIERTRQLRELQQRLVAAERLSAAEEMAGAVAHAVNNPLTALLGTVEMAQQAMLDPHTALERIRLLAKRIEDVIQGTLRMYRRGEVDLQPEAPEMLIERVKTEIAPRALKSQVELICRIEAELPSVLADRTLLGSALTCIAENALQASPDGGRVWLEAEQVHDGRVVRIRISDEGPGIPPHLRAKVLEPFYTTKSGGTGLGLSIASGVVHGHGGTLRIEDRPPRGTSISVELLTTALGAPRQRRKDSPPPTRLDALAPSARVAPASRK